MIELIDEEGGNEQRKRMPTLGSQFDFELPSENGSSETAFRFLTELLPARDLTAEALRDGNAPTTFVPRDGLDRDEPEPLFDHIARILHRARNRHLVLLGRKGNTVRPNVAEESENGELESNENRCSDEDSFGS